MKLSSIHLALLDSAFDRLEEESSISIRFSVCFNPLPEAGNNEFIIQSVNGCETSEQFRRKLELLTAAFLDLINQKAVKMDKEACAGFMDQARDRIQQLKNTARFDRQISMFHRDHPCWVFHHPALDCEPAQALPSFAINAVLRLTSSYAFAWKSVLAECYERLRDIEFYLSHLVNNPPACTAEVPHFSKMMVKSPVPSLACFIFAAREAGLIHSGTKQELYRICCEMFQTSNAPEISPKSFRNHFDNPTPETLQETKNNLHLMITAVNSRLQTILGALLMAISWSLSSLAFDAGDFVPWESAATIF